MKCQFNSFNCFKQRSQASSFVNFVPPQFLTKFVDNCPLTQKTKQSAHKQHFSEKAFINRTYLKQCSFQFLIQPFINEPSAVNIQSKLQPSLKYLTNFRKTKSLLRSNHRKSNILTNILYSGSNARGFYDIVI